MKLSPLDVMLWQRQKLLDGDCLGTVPDTTYACGEQGQYCSPLCFYRSFHEGEKLGYYDGVKAGFEAASELICRELSEMASVSLEIAQTTQDPGKMAIAKAAAIVLGDVSESFRTASSDHAERIGKPPA